MSSESKLNTYQAALNEDLQKRLAASAIEDAQASTRRRPLGSAEQTIAWNFSFPSLLTRGANSIH